MKPIWRLLSRYFYTYFSTYALYHILRLPFSPSVLSFCSFPSSQIIAWYQLSISCGLNRNQIKILSKICSKSNWRIEKNFKERIVIKLLIFEYLKMNNLKEPKKKKSGWEKCQERKTKDLEQATSMSKKLECFFKSK